MISLAMMVEETEAMMMLPTCALLSPRSVRIVGMSGASPNHPKKQTKNMSQVIWKVRIWMVSREKRRILSRGCAVFGVVLVVMIEELNYF
jgi:hypothetical protein